MQSINDIRYIPKEKEFLSITHLQSNLMAEFPDDELKIDSVGFISSRISTLAGNLSSYNFVTLKQDIYNFINRGPEDAKYLREDVLSSSNISDLISISGNLDGKFKEKYLSILTRFGEECTSLKKQIGNCYDSLNELFEEIGDARRFDIGRNETIKKDGSVEIDYDLNKINELVKSHIDSSLQAVIDYEKQKHGIYVQLDKLNIDGNISEKITYVNNDDYQKKLERLVETSEELKFSQERVEIWVASQNEELQKQSIDLYSQSLADYKNALDDVITDKYSLAIMIKQAEEIRKEEAFGRVISPEEQKYVNVFDTIHKASEQFGDEEVFVNARSVIEEFNDKSKIVDDSFELD